MSPPLLTDFKRIVIKVGSSLLVDSAAGRVKRSWLVALAEDIAKLHNDKRDVLVVSSGAIALGRARLKLPRGALKLEESQGAAAVGQIALARIWSEVLGHHGIETGQLLLTLQDTEERRRYLNARSTIARLLDWRAVPVINENDTIATNEIRYGDNDRLAARVASMATADLLILLSDIDGLYDSDPRKGNARFISEVSGPDDLEGVVAGRSSHLGTGGMASKLSSALLAADAGVPVLLAAASDAATALVDASVGTVFAPRPERMSARKFWVRYAAESAGALTLDDVAAEEAPRHRGDTRRQQRPPLLDDRPHRTVVECERPGCLGGVSDPELSR